MTNGARRHVTLPTEILEFLESYQTAHGLPSFSATGEAAVAALERQERQRAYQEYARKYTQNPSEQRDAELWLDLRL